MRERRAPRILILDPALRSRAGHHFNAVKRLQSAVAALGGRAETLCWRIADSEILRELDARAAFEENAYLRRTFDQTEFDRMTQRTLIDLTAALSPLRFAPDVILLPTCDQVLAKALAGYLRLARPARMPGVAAWILLPPALMAKDADQAQRAVEAQIPQIREGFFALADTLGADRRMRLFCETKKLADFYGSAAGLPVDIMPCPTVVRSAERTRRPPGTQCRLQGKGLTIVALGHLNRGKGYELLPVAIDRALAAGIDARFVIHAACPPEDAAGRRLLGMLRETSERVRSRAEELSEAAYSELLHSADLVMLPYDPAIYGERGSGIFNEAESLGIPTVVTAGCSFAERAVAEARSVAAEAYSSEAVAEAIVKAVRGIDALQARQRGSDPTDRDAEDSDEVESLLASLLATEAIAGNCGRGPELGRVLRRSLAEGRHLRVSADRRLRALLGPAAWRRRLRSVQDRLETRGSTAHSAPERRAWVADLYGDPAWDVAAPRPPRTRYLIAAMHRSGSNLMVRQLFRAGAGLPAEYFHPDLTRPLLARWGFERPDGPAYLDLLHALRQSAGGTWGAKLHWEHVEGLSAPTASYLFPGTRVIFTRRRNLAMQALSYARALRTGRWDPRWPADVTRRGDIDLDNLDHLARIAGGLVDDELRWVELFGRYGLRVHQVCYEDYVAEPDAAHRRIFDFLGVDCGLPPPEVAPKGKTGARSEDQQLVSRLSEVLTVLSAKRPDLG